MSGIVRKGDLCSGHGDFPSRSNSSGSTNVFVNNKPVVREGDSWERHCNPLGECHSSVSSKGSSTVFANNRSINRIGDSVSCGSNMIVGSSNVFAN